MNKRHTSVAKKATLTAAAAILAVLALSPTAAQAAQGMDAPSTTESLNLVIERQPNVFLSFDLRQDGAVVAAPGVSRSFDDASERAATVTAPAVGESGKVVFANGSCLQAFGPNGSGFTVVSNDCDSARTTWERTASGALRVVGAQTPSAAFFGNANSITHRATTGPERPVGIDSHK
jgi:hypothetical protein